MLKHNILQAVSGLQLPDDALWMRHVIDTRALGDTVAYSTYKKPRDSFKDEIRATGARPVIQPLGRYRWETAASQPTLGTFELIFSKGSPINPKDISFDRPVLRRVHIATDFLFPHIGWARDAQNWLINTAEPRWHNWNGFWHPATETYYWQDFRGTKAPAKQFTAYLKDYDPRILRWEVRADTPAMVEALQLHRVTPTGIKGVNPRALLQRLFKLTCTDPRYIDARVRKQLSKWPYRNMTKAEQVNAAVSVRNRLKRSNGCKRKLPTIPLREEVEQLFWSFVPSRLTICMGDDDEFSSQ